MNRLAVMHGAFDAGFVLEGWTLTAAFLLAFFALAAVLIIDDSNT